MGWYECVNNMIDWFVVLMIFVYDVLDQVLMVLEVFVICYKVSFLVMDKWFMI